MKLAWLQCKAGFYPTRVRFQICTITAVRGCRIDVESRRDYLGSWGGVPIGWPKPNVTPSFELSG